MKNKSLTISSAVPSALSQNLFQFDIATAGNIGSIAFEYCSNSPLILITCVAPPGLNTTGLTLSGQTTNIGFTYDAGSSTANKIVLTRASSPAVVATSSYTFDNIINPSASNTTTFVRISTYTSGNGTGSFTDNGSVAFSTSLSAFSVGIFVPPYLTFCVGQTVALNCSSVGGVLVNFGEFTSSNAAVSTTQFSVATNDAIGYNVFMSGQTLTSGNTIISPLTATSSSSPGVSQFGINLRSNTSPSVGAEPSGLGSGTVATSYNIQNLYRFVNGERIAYSTLPTDFTRFTVSYIANVPDSQAPGLYATTLTYTAVASF